jgi:hypothetical protein
MMRLNKDNIKVAGHKGTWYVVDEVQVDGETILLLEHNTYGEDAPWIAIDEDGQLVMEDITDGAEELIERLAEENYIL